MASARESIRPRSPDPQDGMLPTTFLRCWPNINSGPQLHLPTVELGGGHSRSRP
jgi:hypothetical protein